MLTKSALVLISSVLILGFAMTAQADFTIINNSGKDIVLNIKYRPNLSINQNIDCTWDYQAAGLKKDTNGAIIPAKSSVKITKNMLNWQCWSANEQILVNVTMEKQTIPCHQKNGENGTRVNKLTVTAGSCICQEDP